MNPTEMQTAYALLDEIAACAHTHSADQFEHIDRTVRILCRDLIDLLDYWEFLLKCYESDFEYAE